MNTVNYLKNGKKGMMISRIKNIIVLGFMFFVLGCSNVKKEARIEVKTYDNQVIKEIGYMIDTIKVGTWYEFDEDGYLNFIFNYKDGKLTGDAYEYRKGKLFGEYHFKNGRLNGSSIRYRLTNQQILDIENYFKGKPKGIQLYFDSLGVLNSIENGNGVVIYSVEQKSSTGARVPLGSSSFATKIP